MITEDQIIEHMETASIKELMELRQELREDDDGEYYLELIID